MSLYRSRQNLRYSRRGPVLEQLGAERNRIGRCFGAEHFTPGMGFYHRKFEFFYTALL